MNINNIRKIIRAGRILEQEPMSRHTSFRVGGPARYFITPANKKELSGLLRYLNGNGLPYFILGNGSNLLVSDRGYEGTVIDLGKNDGTEFTLLGIDDGTDPSTEGKEGEILFDAGAGCLMSAIGSFAKRFGAAGFEALSGIPGCIGGACIMNAGAYGSEMKEVLHSVEVVTPKGEILQLPASELDLGYRHSNLQDRGYVVARAVLSLRKGDPEEIGRAMEDFTRRRKEKQPLEYPSAGSTFKRPEGAFAGQLIEEAGLRGYRIGGAAVSEKHCGFLINQDQATADDIYRLIGYVQEKVFEHSGIRLEPEVRMLGQFA